MVRVERKDIEDFLKDLDKVSIKHGMYIDFTDGTFIRCGETDFPLVTIDAHGGGYKDVLVELLKEAITHKCECPPWEETHLGNCKQFHAQRALEMFVGDTPEKLLELLGKVHHEKTT